MAATVTERAMGAGRKLITVTGTDSDVADTFATGTGVSNAKYYWNGDPSRIVWETGAVGAVTICYIATSG